LLERNTQPPEDQKLFFANPRGFNTSVSFASTKTTDHHFATPGVPTMRINGQINHAYGPIINDNINKEPVCLQCYFTEGNHPTS
jgi:hypothetical protein